MLQKQRFINASAGVPLVHLDKSAAKDKLPDEQASRAPPCPREGLSPPIGSADILTMVMIFLFPV